MYYPYDYRNCCSCLCCPQGCGCYCGNDPTDNGCTCHLDPYIKLKYNTVLLEMKGTNVPLMQLAVFFEHAFPEQIMIPVHLTNKRVSFDFRNQRVKDIIQKLGLIPLRDKLMPRAQSIGKEKRNYCCRTYFIDISTGAKHFIKDHNYSSYPQLAKERCQLYALEDGANSSEYDEGHC